MRNKKTALSPLPVFLQGSPWCISKRVFHYIRGFPLAGPPANETFMSI